MLAVSVVLVALIQGAFSNCPEIRNDERREYPVGSTLVISCPGSTSLTYAVTCTNGGLWDHSLLGTSCTGTGRPTAAPTSTAAPLPPATMPSMTCPYIAGFMRNTDAGKTFPQGAVYDMICTNSGGTFAATCRNGAWVYRVNACPGIVQPTPPSPTTPVIPTGPATANPTGTCPYLLGYMLQSDASLTFVNGDVYRMACQPPNEARRFEAVCDNGQWYGNQGTCSGGLFGGGLFGRRPTPTQVPRGNLRPCAYVSGLMLESDAAETFPDRTQYRLRCVDQNAVVPVVLATCVDGTWSYDPNACFRRASTQQSGLQIGNSNIPLWLLLLG